MANFHVSLYLLDLIVPLVEGWVVKLIFVGLLVAGIVSVHNQSDLSTSICCLISQICVSVCVSGFFDLLQELFLSFILF